MPSNPWRLAAQSLLLLSFYVLTAKLGLAMDAVGGYATLVWPPTGIALAALLLWNQRLWPVVLLAAFLVNFFTGAPLLVALGIGCGNALEAALAAHLLRRSDFHPSIHRLRDVFSLVLLAAVVSTATSAVIGASCLLAGGVITPGELLATGRAWWIGDALSMLVVAPALLTWRQRPPRAAAALGAKGVIESLLLLLTTLFVFLVVFGYMPLGGLVSQPYLFFTVIVWSALRRGMRATTQLTLAICCVSIAATSQGIGPFAKESLAESLIVLQVFIACLAVTALFLAATDAERTQASALAKQAEEREAGAARMRSILHSAYDAFVGMDAGGLITEWNRQAEVTFGWKHDEVRGRLLADILIPARLREMHRRGLEHFLATGEGPVLNKRLELPALHQEGHELPIEMTISSVKLGDAYAFGAFLRDITLEQKTKRIQDIQLSLTRILAEAAPVSDILPRMLATVCQRLGWDFGDVWILEKGGSHLKPAAFWHSGDARLEQFQTVSSRASFAPGHGLPGRVWETQQVIWVADVVVDGNFPRAPAAGVADLHGAVAFPIVANSELIGVGEFFSRRIYQEDKQIVELVSDIGARLGLYIQRDLANAANAAKSAFLANMSHEIRTPLGAVLGFSELLGSQDLPPEERARYLDAIKRNGDLLSTVINDILDLSKVEAGKVEIDLQDVRLEEVLNDAATLCNLQAIDKGVTLTIKSDGEVPDVVRTDSLRLRQILINIIGNAVKFTAKGGVDVSVRYMADQHGAAKLAFIVTDTGIGIDPAQVGRLFEPFTQADPSFKRKHGGTGLGLVLSKRLAGLLGGDVTLTESQPGKGSTFVVTIDPGAAATVPSLAYDDAWRFRLADAEAAPTVSSLSHIKVLVVEDAADNRLLVGRMLNLAGARVEMAENGQQGVDMALRQAYDVILMDLQMPVMDGFEALAALRARGIETPVVALTAHAFRDEQQRCLAAGFDAHLAKPINRSAMLTLLASLSAAT